MAGYEDTKQKIIDSLMGRPAGTEIQPENHQDFALSLLEYSRSIELISASTLIGVAQANTVPVQPNTSRVSYLAGVGPANSVTFVNFKDINGQPITVTTDMEQSYIVILLWNMQYWSAEKILANVLSESENAYFFYNLTIRKTYSSVAAMNADVTHPIGNNGVEIKVGEIVSVHNEDNPEEDAIYSYESGPRWQLQMKLSALDSRVFDGGRADTKYGGARNINCGNAQG